MKNLLVGILIPGVLAVLGIVLLVSWTGVGPVESLQARVPGLDRPGSVAERPAVPPVAELTTFDGVAAEASGSWPRFRGGRFDNICADGIELARQWPEDGPEVLWLLELGEGHAGAAVFNGRVYVLDYDRENEADALRCFSPTDGGEIWRVSYPNVVKRNHGMSRTVPALTEDYCLTLGPKCHVMCVHPTTGEPYWPHVLDLVNTYGATVPPWYAGQCPLIDGDRAILAPGGDALLIALECKTGNLIWKSPNPKAWVMTHSSIMPMEFAGRKMYVYCGKGGVAGVAADDGSLLWQTTAWKIAIATCPSPVILPEGKIFCSGGYNSGAVMLQLKENGEKIDVETAFRLKPRQFGSTQQTPIFLNGYLYGVREKDKELVCLDLEGKEVWASGSQHRFGAGPYLIADGMIYVLDDDGLLTLAEAMPDEYRQLAQARVLDGHDSWGPMAMVDGKLILRDLTRMACLDVRKK